MYLGRAWSTGSLPYLAEVGIYLVGGIALGVVMSKVVEIPALKLRERLFPSMSQPLSRPA